MFVELFERALVMFNAFRYVLSRLMRVYLNLLLIPTSHIGSARLVWSCRIGDGYYAWFNVGLGIGNYMHRRSQWA